jgi:hypothetical protein
MAISRELQKLISDALLLVRRHPNHDLSLGYRHAIWATFGDDENAHVGRARLANFTVRHVLPIWNQKFPHDDRPLYILNLAEQVIAGKINKAVASEESERLWRLLQQVGYEGYGMAFTVGCAALASLDTAIDD